MCDFIIADGYVSSCLTGRDLPMSAESIISSHKAGGQMGRMGMIPIFARQFTCGAGRAKNCSSERASIARSMSTRWRLNS
jgi:hypothetical protein